MAGLKADFETIAKSYREIAFQRRATLQEIWSVLNSSNHPEGQLDIIRSMVKSSGIWIESENKT